MIPVDKLAWMAGIIDLKGRIIRKNNKQRKTQQVVLMVETKIIPIIRELSTLTGTNPEYIQGSNVKEWLRKGCAEHCPERHVHVESTNDYPQMMPPHGRWTITGAGAAIVIYNLELFLVSDNGLPEMMHEVIEKTVLTGQGSAMVLTSIRRLSLLGWQLPEKFQVVME